MSCCLGSSGMKTIFFTLEGAAVLGQVTRAGGIALLVRFEGLASRSCSQRDLWEAGWRWPASPSTHTSVSQQRDPPASTQATHEPTALPKRASVVSKVSSRVSVGAGVHSGSPDVILGGHLHLAL